MSEIDAPEYADPARYAELAGFEGDYRDLWWNADFLALLAARWRLAARHSILDLGCGAGHWGLRLLPALAADAQLTGVDHEPDFLSYARERAAKRGLGERCTYVEGRAEALPFPDASFDVVTCQTVLIHVADASVVAAEMARVLRPGGIAIACEPDNLAGKLALLGDSLAIGDEDTLELLRFTQTCQRGKLALGEGDERVGHRLPGLFADAGLESIRAHTSDRCMAMLPPYDAPGMRLAIDQELAWAEQGLAVIAPTEHDARRLHGAGGGSEAEFEAGWAAASRWREGFVREAKAGTYRAARGYLMYACSGEKPR